MKGVLFDLDGVIADTAVFHFAAWRKLVRDHFQAELPDELEEKTKGVSREDSLKVILDYLQLSVSDEEFAALAAEKNEAYVETLEDLKPTHILPGIADLISDFKQAGLKLGLASASKNGPIILDKLGLADAFDAIADPSKVAQGKPAPDIFLAAAAALNLQPADCVGLEDSVAGVTAINAAGMVSIGIGGAELAHASERFESTSDLSYPAIEAAWQANR